MEEQNTGGNKNNSYPSKYSKCFFELGKNNSGQTEEQTKQPILVIVIMIIRIITTFRKSVLQ